MGCADGADADLILEARKEQEEEERMRELEEERAERGEESATAGSYNITATPVTMKKKSRKHGKHKKEDLGTIDEDLDDEALSDAVLHESELNAKCKCVVFAFERVLTVSSVLKLDVLAANCERLAVDGVTSEALSGAGPPEVDASDWTKYFGGVTRTRKLLRLLKTLRNDRRLGVYVISHALTTEALTAVMTEMEFVPNASDVAADIGSFALLQECLIGKNSSLMEEGKGKNSAIFAIQKKEKLSFDELLYIDCNRSLVRYFASIGLCRVLFVKDRHGLSKTTLAKIHQMFDTGTDVALATQ